ncbi:MAG: hypothetical protein V2B19_15120 [Pseudomonadota bacterium]
MEKVQISRIPRGVRGNVVSLDIDGFQKRMALIQYSGGFNALPSFCGGI